jgi:hypothetical protein
MPRYSVAVYFVLTADNPLEALTDIDKHTKTAAQHPFIQRDPVEIEDVEEIAESTERQSTWKETCGNDFVRDFEKYA